MNMIIITEMRRLIADIGEEEALADVLDSIHTSLGSISENSDAIASLRDHFRDLIE